MLRISNATITLIHLCIRLKEHCYYLKRMPKKFFKDLNLGITSEQFVLLDNIYCNPGIAQVELSTIALKFPSNTIRILH